MRINSKLPKTFSVYASYGENKGFIRFKSYIEENGKIKFTPTFVESIKDSSKFVNFDNAKKRALEMAEKYNFDETKVIDDKLMKYYYVKK